ncbi:hypothetical protein ASPZODRAFT_76572 [Penicilliopsis zonata CBS 506.65]|uniref:AB hydrolase-1 domain-containing protein n=1 Tax=Penicilliopsis zonata CBS 506.65 TaxID=1073090 RepID=A0A1L9S636_9EURO|nr:hypothetical protein ASPZODRAFT_76572 [Penicilliopsis zonata CBS 506.65]OJJ42624.1 hypothetical protein ASPZODRAFT_76572 [Penicilliopsis zonata CBS 506.65]
MSKFWPKGSPGILHHYTETLVTFEYTAPRSQPHSLLFIGGLGDGLSTTSYLAELAKGLQSTQWALFTLITTSSYQSWGLGHLDRDTDEIARCINYIRAYKPAGRIVLMGHSTGSQCVLHYLSRPNPHTTRHAFDAGLEHVTRPALDGAIMQAPVSDREAVSLIRRMGFCGRSPASIQAAYEEALASSLAAERSPKAEEEKKTDTLLSLDVLNRIGYPAGTPLSTRRFLSLVSPESPAAPREDDLFSSDLPDSQLEATFGKIRTNGLLRDAAKLLVLYSGADQSVPAWVDKEALLARWRRATDHDGAVSIWDAENGGIIPNASHALSNDDQAGPLADLVRRVTSYLSCSE